MFVKKTTIFHSSFKSNSRAVKLTKVDRILLNADVRPRSRYCLRLVASGWIRWIVSRAFCQFEFQDCRRFPWPGWSASVFTSYVRAPATFFPATTQDRVQVARAERRWNTIVEHGDYGDVGVPSDARSTSRRIRNPEGRSAHTVHRVESMMYRYLVTRAAMTLVDLLSFFLSFFFFNEEAILKRLLCEPSQFFT